MIAIQTTNRGFQISCLIPGLNRIKELPQGGSFFVVKRKKLSFAEKIV